MNGLPFSVMLVFLLVGQGNSEPISYFDTKLKEAYLQYTKASFYFQNKKIKESIDLYQKSLDIYGRSSFVIIKLCEAKLSLGDTIGVRESLLPLADSKSKFSSQANLLLASLSFKENQQLSAISFLNQALFANPKNRRVYSVLAKLYNENTMTDEIESLYIKGIENFPNELEFYQNLGKYYYNSGRFDKSYEVYSKAKKIWPDNIEILIGIAMSQERLGKIDEAIVGFKNLIKKQPLNIELYRNLLPVLVKSFKYEQAYEVCENWVLVSPNSLEPIYQYAWVSIREGNPKKGIEYLEKFRNTKKPLGGIYYWLGRLNAAAQNNKEAIVHYQKEIEISGLSKETALPLALIMHKENKTIQAIEVLKKVEKQGDTSPSIYNLIGYFIIESEGDINEAILYIEKALKQDPTNPAYIDSLAWSLFKKGQVKEAYIYQKEAKKLDPDSAIITKHLEIITAEMNRESK